MNDESSSSCIANGLPVGVGAECLDANLAAALSLDVHGEGFGASLVAVADISKVPGGRITPFGESLAFGHRHRFEKGLEFHRFHRAQISPYGDAFCNTKQWLHQSVQILSNGCMEE